MWTMSPLLDVEKMLTMSLPCDVKKLIGCKLKSQRMKTFGQRTKLVWLDKILSFFEF